MAENQHMQIKGYRKLSQAEVELMNEVKAKAEEVGILVAKLDGMLIPGKVPNEELDHRWIAIGRTHLQEGFMALTRAIAKPTTF